MCLCFCSCCFAVLFLHWLCCTVDTSPLMAIVHFLYVCGTGCSFDASAVFDMGMDSYTWRSEIQGGARWTWAGFGLSAPFLFTLHPC